MHGSMKTQKRRLHGLSSYKAQSQGQELMHARDQGSLPQVHQRVMDSTMTPSAVYSSSLVLCSSKEGCKAVYTSSRLVCSAVQKPKAVHKILQTHPARLLTCSMMPISSAACDSCTPMVRLTLKESPVARCTKAKISVSQEEGRPVAYSPTLML